MTFTEYVDKSFEGVKETQALYKFKQQKIAQMSERANALIASGLKDTAVMHSIIIGESPDLKQEFKTLMSEKKAQSKKAKLSKLAILGALGYALSLIVAYILVSFATGAWGKTWLIIVAGILLPVGLGCILVTKKGVGKQGAFSLLSRLTLAGGIFVITTVVFLFLLILTDIEGTYAIYLLAVALSLIADAVYARATKQKLAIISYLIYIPAIAAIIYPVLGAFGVIAWHPGWLIIVGAVIVDIVIVMAKVAVGGKTDEEEFDEWNED